MGKYIFCHFQATVEGVWLLSQERWNRKSRENTLEGKKRQFYPQLFEQPLFSFYCCCRCCFFFVLVNWQHYSSLDVPHNRTSQVALVVRNLPASAGDVRHVGSIPGSGRPPGGGHGNPLQCSCLDNPVDRGAWWAALHRVAKSWTWLK